MQKKAENTFSISKFIQKNKNGKKIVFIKRKDLFGCFCFYIPCALFLHFKHYDSYKKDKYVKKAENNISKKDAKKAEMYRKRCKKAGGCKLYQTNLGDNYLKHMFWKKYKI